MRVESRLSIRTTLQYREQSTNPSYTDDARLYRPLSEWRENKSENKFVDFSDVSRCPLTFIFRVADRRREAELPKFESNLIFPKPRR